MLINFSSYESSILQHCYVVLAFINVNLNHWRRLCISWCHLLSGPLFLSNFSAFSTATVDYVKLFRYLFFMRNMFLLIAIFCITFTLVMWLAQVIRNMWQSIPRSLDPNFLRIVFVVLVHAFISYETRRISCSIILNFCTIKILFVIQLTYCWTCYYIFFVYLFFVIGFILSGESDILMCLLLYFVYCDQVSTSGRYHFFIYEMTLVASKVGIFPFVNLLLNSAFKIKISHQFIK